MREWRNIVVSVWRCVGVYGSVGGTEVRMCGSVSGGMEVKLRVV